MLNRDCSVCGKDFTPKPRQKSSYCTDACRVWQLRHPGERRISSGECAHCHGPVNGHNTYCSKVCGDAYRNALKAEYPKQSDCAECGSTYTQKRAVHTTCSTSCFNAQYRAAHPDKYTYNDTKRTADQKRRAVKRGATVEKVVASKVYERDEWTCGLCREPVDRSLEYPDPKSASLDHIVPLSKGGAHSYANTQCAHLDCNVRKGAGGGLSTPLSAVSVRAAANNVYTFPTREAQVAS